MRSSVLLLCLFVLCASCSKRPLIVSDSGTSILCVVRHAEAFSNLEPPPSDMTATQLDALTKAGHKQARKLGRSVPRGVTRVWSSPLNRTRETAEALNLGPEVTVEPDLQPLGEQSAEEGAARARGLLIRLHEELPPGEHAVFVTHGDIAALTLGELRGHPIDVRATKDRLAIGGMSCVPLPP